MYLETKNALREQDVSVEYGVCYLQDSISAANAITNL